MLKGVDSIYDYEICLTIIIKKTLKNWSHYMMPRLMTATTFDRNCHHKPRTTYIAESHFWSFCIVYVAFWSREHWNGSTAHVKDLRDTLEAWIGYVPGQCIFESYFFILLCLVTPEKCNCHVTNNTHYPCN